ncbi:MAG: LacI family DNA-binding transcriptional regulator [Ilumatobacteraceae bacterium]
MTIWDVAARAGVSIATVSRVVNGRYGVAQNTITRVREAIDDLDFESSLVARSLRSQRTNVIGILVAGIEPFSAELLKGAARAIEDSGFELVVYSGGMHGKEGWERRYLSRLSGTLTDGTILVTPTVVEVATAQPVVAVDPHVGGSQLPTVDAQNYEGAISATRHLIGLGHRRIGFLAGRPDLESARRREAGYRSALAEAGIEFDPQLVEVGSFTEETAEAPARTLLTLKERPSAVFAANDLSAIQVLRTAAELGLAVPGDVSVVGFDNIPESALVDPPLTTVDQSIQAQGDAAVRLLLRLIEQSDHPPDGAVPHITLPSRLVVRHSCRDVRLN